LSNRLQSEGEIGFEPELIEIENVEKSRKMRALRTAADVAKLVAEEIRTIVRVVPEIWLSQVLCLSESLRPGPGPILCLFMFRQVFCDE
jgi:hypothetical protein